jgi:hypothetical protein
MRKPETFLFAIVLLLALTHTVPAQEDAKQTLPFDSFGDLKSDDAGARMDNFAIQLQEKPEMEGYIVFYGTEGDGSGASNNVFQALTDYLVNTRGIEQEQIKTIYGGRYKKLGDVSIELWVIPRGAPAPELKHYRSKIETFTGKFDEYGAWDGYPDGGDGPSLGAVSFAAYADALKQQPKTLAYIVAFNSSVSAPGTWRRVAKRTVDNLHEYGISADRIKIIYGGIAKKKNEDEYEDAQSARLQLWILPADAPPPVKEAKPERTPKEAVQIGSYNNYYLKTTHEERLIFEGFADVLHANRKLNVCFIVHPLIETEEKYSLPDEPPDIEPSKVIERWKTELTEKYGVEANRIYVLTGATDEYNGGMIEVWAVPLGATLPDPFASPDETTESDNF